MTAPDVDAMLAEEGPAAVQAELDRLREENERLRAAAVLEKAELIGKIVKHATNVVRIERDDARKRADDLEKFSTAVMVWRARRDEATRVRFDLEMREQGVTTDE